nr:hypothetical protein [Pandoravirus belohorizontensis]
MGSIHAGIFFGMRIFSYFSILFPLLSFSCVRVSRVPPSIPVDRVFCPSARLLFFPPTWPCRSAASPCADRVRDRCRPESCALSFVLTTTTTTRQATPPSEKKDERK